MKTLQTIRGMGDIKPGDIQLWQYVEHTFKCVLDQYGYQEIRTPILEPTGLFQRGVGEHTDIVEKEMYTFLDRSNDSVTLRPEFTAGIVRAGIQHGLFYNQTQRLWTLGPLFRYERPQKGRYRQFHQLSVETFGMSDPEIDAEVILLSARLWKIFGLSDSLSLQMNTLGTPEERKDYRKALVSYFEQHFTELDADSQKRLHSNPLRILDSKNEQTCKVIENCPKIHDFLSKPSLDEFARICSILEKNGVKFEVNPSLVRGLDYYCKTVFEWTTSALGAQGTVCGGGRYDKLSEQLGGKAVPACGFGLGIERLILLLEKLGNTPQNVNQQIDVMFVVGGEAYDYAFSLVERFRNCLSHTKIQMGIGGSFKSQLKRADRLGASIAIFLGDEEVKNSLLTIKYLREKKEQNRCHFDEALNILKDYYLKK